MRIPILFTNLKKEIMKLTMNTESSNLLLEAKRISGGNFNSLLKEAMELLIQKYIQQQKDQYDPIKTTKITRN